MKPLSIYVHIPFCERKCPYCDFLSREGGEHEEYVNQLCNEMKTPDALRHPLYNRGNYIVKTIYFGGGTPSLVDAGLIAKILKTIRTEFDVVPDAEISIECNPNSITREKLETYRDIGINRISIGVQSFCDKTLKVLGRVHNVKQAKDAIKLAGEYFDNVSIDLIHSVPDCKLKISRKHLTIVKHVSAYCLTSDKYMPVSDEVSIKEQQSIEKCLAKRGLEKYEVSNFARPGYECKHNIVYWTCGEWLGFGESAQSHFNEEWSDSDRIMLGLRMVRGVPRELLEGKWKAVEQLAAQGLLRVDNGMVACTSSGFLVFNSFLCKLL